MIQNHRIQNLTKMVQEKSEKVLEGNEREKELKVKLIKKDDFWKQKLEK